MFLNSLTKFGVGGGTILGALTLSEVTPAFNSAEQSRTQFKKEIGTIKTLDDIEVLESKNGCVFSFIDSFGNNKAYRARKYHSIVSKNENLKKVNWNERIVWAANNWKNRCTPGGFIPLAWNNNETQTFFVKEEENHG